MNVSRRLDEIERRIQRPARTATPTKTVAFDYDAFAKLCAGTFDRCIRRRPGESRGDVRDRLHRLVTEWYAWPCGYTPADVDRVADRMTARAMLSDAAEEKNA
jgi:hypothetical protein